MLAGTAARLLPVETSQIVLTKKVCNIQGKMSQLLANSASDFATLHLVKKWLSKVIIGGEQNEDSQVASPSLLASENMDPRLFLQDRPPLDSSFGVQERPPLLSRKEANDTTPQKVKV